MLIGPDFKPFYAADKGTDLGVTSWPPQAWKIGGGNVWGWVTYDAGAEHGVLRHAAIPGPGTRSSGPAITNGPTGIFARDPATGAARWYYQYSPHDEHDYDGVNEQLLLDMPFGGKMHKVLIHLDRNGYIYVIDRNTAGAIGRSLRAGQFDPRASICRPGA